MSSDKEQEYFCDGLAEEIINALAQVPGVNVTARTSAFSFQGQGRESLDDIARVAWSTSWKAASAKPATVYVLRPS